MAWEMRKGRKYYYRSVWRDGEVVKVYLGRGAEASRAAAEVIQRANNRKLEAAAFEQWSRKMDAIDGPLKTMRALANEIMELDLINDNFYQAGRVWRQRKRS